MEDVIGELLSRHGSLVLICITVMGCLWIHSWMRVNLLVQAIRLAESSMERDQVAMILDRVWTSRSAGPGLLEQYGRLSRGTRVLLLLFLICLAFIVLVLMPVSIMTQTIHSHHAQFHHRNMMVESGAIQPQRFGN